MSETSNLTSVPGAGNLLLYSDTVPAPGLKYGDGLRSASELPYITDALVNAWGGDVANFEAFEQAKLYNYDIVTPQMFGAKGDNSSDDTIAFQAMFNSGIKSVYLPSGNYIISDKITIPNTVKNIVGAGRDTTFIKFTSNLYTSMQEPAESIDKLLESFDLTGFSYINEQDDTVCADGLNICDFSICGLNDDVFDKNYYYLDDTEVKTLAHSERMANMIGVGFQGLIKYSSFSRLSISNVKKGFELIAGTSSSSFSDILIKDCRICFNSDSDSNDSISTFSGIKYNNCAFIRAGIVLNMPFDGNCIFFDACTFLNNSTVFKVSAIKQFKVQSCLLKNNDYTLDLVGDYVTGSYTIDNCSITHYIRESGIQVPEDFESYNGIDELLSIAHLEGSTRVFNPEHNHSGWLVRMQTISEDVKNSLYNTISPAKAIINACNVEVNYVNAYELENNGTETAYKEVYSNTNIPYKCISFHKIDNTDLVGCGISFTKNSFNFPVKSFYNVFDFSDNTIAMGTYNMLPVHSDIPAVVFGDTQVFIESSGVTGVGMSTSDSTLHFYGISTYGDFTKYFKKSDSSTEDIFFFKSLTDQVNGGVEPMNLNLLGCNFLVNGYTAPQGTLTIYHETAENFTNHRFVFRADSILFFDSIGTLGEHDSMWFTNYICRGRPMTDIG